MLPKRAPQFVSASAVYGSPNLTTVVFDQELMPGSLDHTKWSGRLNNQVQGSDVCGAAGKNVTWQSYDAGADVGADTVTYDDATADLMNRFGNVPAASFSETF